jgi:hypothetical protein
MSVFQYLAAGAALSLVVWPMLPSMGSLSLFGPPPYRDAIWHLSRVRSRLRATTRLDDDEKRAIDVLTLALVDGSDS